MRRQAALAPQDACRYVQPGGIQHQIIDILSELIFNTTFQKSYVKRSVRDSQVKKKQKNPEKSAYVGVLLWRSLLSQNGASPGMLVHTSVHLCHYTISSYPIQATAHQRNACQYPAHPKDPVAPSCISALLYKRAYFTMKMKDTYSPSILSGQRQSRPFLYPSPFPDYPEVISSPPALATMM